MEMKLEFIGEDDFYLPTYRDEEGRLWKDTEMHSIHLEEDEKVDKSSLCTSTSNAFDGEPNVSMISIEKYNDVDIVLSFNEVPKPLPNREDYMFLGRLKSDCDYYLGYGGRYDGHLWAKNVDDQIEKMKKLHNSFADDQKPEWLTYDDVLNYEKEMKKEI